MHCLIYAILCTMYSINNKQVGSANNMHRRYFFDITVRAEALIIMLDLSA